MKFNKWTLGLAAVGAVSMASAVRADETPKLSPVETALSSTVISGYVSSSVNFSLDPNNTGTTASGPGGQLAQFNGQNNGQIANSPAGNIPLQSGKANGFSLDVVKLSIAKAQDESPWASGYNVDLLFGPDAVGWNPSVNGNNNSDFSIAQAYIALRTPVGNGIDWKVGVFNTVVGYESFDPASNPNYTRSWGWAVEPTENQGILGAYKINDEFSFNAGVANTLNAGINNRNTYDNSNGSPWHKAFMGSATFTAPSNWGWVSGSAFYVGAIYGWGGGTASSNTSNPGTSEQGGNQANYYAGATLNSPWKDVTFGAAFDYVQNVGGGTYTENVYGNSLNDAVNHIDDAIWSLYNTVKLTDKLSLNTRGEYWTVDGKGNSGYGQQGGWDNGISLTETVEYDVFANVTSRIEFRYDKVLGDAASQGGYSGYVLPTGTAIGNPSSYGLYLNMVYKF